MTASSVTTAMQIISLTGTAVGEVIQTSSSLYAVTRYENQRFWAILSGLCFMTPLVLLPGYNELERLSLGAVVAVLFTAVAVSVETASLTPAAPASSSIPELASLFTGISGIAFAWGGLVYHD